MGDTSTDFDNFTDMMVLNLYGTNRNVFYQVRPVFTCNSAPAFTMTNRENSATGSKHTALVSIPMLSRYSHTDIDDLPIERLYITMKDPLNTEATANLT